MTDAPRPLIDVILPVHRTDRPLDRAVASVVDGGLPVAPDGGVRILVVCHNLDPELVPPMLRPEFRDMVTYLERRDNGRTPGEPRNFALGHVEAEYVAFLDSDDTFDPGALARWAGIAREHGSAVVVPRLSRSGGGHVRTPATRPWRSKNLDVLADRLAYRTSIFGLVRADAIERLGLRFPEGMVAGEDQSFSLQFYAEAGRVDYARGRPGYMVHEDVEHRVTTTFNPLADELRPFLMFGDSPWLRSQSPALRRSYAVKVLRIHLFGQVTDRVRSGRWSAEDAQAAQAALLGLLEQAPGAEEAMCRADRDLMDLLGRGETDVAKVAGAAEARRRFGAPATLVPRRFTKLLHRDGSLRFMAASALMS